MCVFVGDLQAAQVCLPVLSKLPEEEKKQLQRHLKVKKGTKDGKKVQIFNTSPI